MPKKIELTVEIVVQKVSCPGVWLCQDGSVSLIVYALDTSYETCMLPPSFPLKFNDKLYFRKTFQETCALSNMSCLLEEEALYCELVQWCQTCFTVEPKLLAQYLGSLSDVLFPPKMFCSDGVDLLMRRSKNYPGILSPKIEIATKVRIDEVWNDKCIPYAIPKIPTCHCISRIEYGRQKAACHTAEYHRNKCPLRTRSKSKSSSRSRSRESGSYMSLKDRIPEKSQFARSDPVCKSVPQSPRTRSPCRQGDRYRRHCVYNVDVGDCWKRATDTSYEKDDDSGCPICKSAPLSPRTPRSRYRRDYCVYNVEEDNRWNRATDGNHENDNVSGSCCRSECSSLLKPQADVTHPKQRDKEVDDNEDKRVLLESRYVDDEKPEQCKDKPNYRKKYAHDATRPCICEICRRYHELFHAECS